MNESIVIKTLMAALVVCAMTGCNQSQLNGKVDAAASVDPGTLQRCNEFRVLENGSTLMDVKVRHPSTFDANVDPDSRLLLKVVSLENRWSDKHLHSQFFRRSGLTGIQDPTPLQVSVYLKNSSARFVNALDGISVDALAAFDQQLTAQAIPHHSPIGFDDVDVIVEGVDANYHMISVRYDQSVQFSNASVEFLIPKFSADPNAYKANHVAPAFAVGDKMTLLHPFKDYLGQQMNFGAMAEQMFCF